MESRLAVATGKIDMKGYYMYIRNLKLACFVCYIKLSTLFFLKILCASWEIVQGPSSFKVMDQSSQNIVFIIYVFHAGNLSCNFKV